MNGNYSADGVRIKSEQKFLSGVHITKKILNEFKKEFHVDETITVPKYSQVGGNSTTRKSNSARIKAKYDHFILVTNELYDWCVNYIDLYKIKCLHNAEPDDDEIEEVDEEE